MLFKSSESVHDVIQTLAKGLRSESVHATAAFAFRKGMHVGRSFSSLSNIPHIGTVPLNSRVLILHVECFGLPTLEVN